MSHTARIRRVAALCIATAIAGCDGADDLATLPTETPAADLEAAGIRRHIAAVDRDGESGRTAGPRPRQGTRCAT